MNSQERLDDIADALKRAESAIEKIKRSLENVGVADLGDRIAEVSGEALREVEDLVARSENLTEAEAKLRSAVRRRPLTTLALAFGAGLALALLTRG